MNEYGSTSCADKQLSVLHTQRGVHCGIVHNPELHHCWVLSWASPIRRDLSQCHHCWDTSWLTLTYPLLNSCLYQRKSKHLCTPTPKPFSCVLNSSSIWWESSLHRNPARERGTQADRTPKMHPAVSSSKCTVGSALNIFPLHGKDNLKKSWSTRTDNVWFPMLLTMESMVPGG